MEYPRGHVCIPFLVQPFSIQFPRRFWAALPARKWSQTALHRPLACSWYALDGLLSVLINVYVYSPRLSTRVHAEIVNIVSPKSRRGQKGCCKTRCMVRCILEKIQLERDPFFWDIAKKYNHGWRAQHVFFFAEPYLAGDGNSKDPGSCYHLWVAWFVSYRACWVFAGANDIWLVNFASATTILKLNFFLQDGCAVFSFFQDALDNFRDNDSVQVFVLLVRHLQDLSQAHQQANAADGRAVDEAPFQLLDAVPKLWAAIGNLSVFQSSVPLMLFWGVNVWEMNFFCTFRPGKSLHFWKVPT